MQVEIRDDDAYKFAFAVCKHPRELVFLIVQINQCPGNDVLIFYGEGIRIVKIAGDRRL